MCDAVQCYQDTTQLNSSISTPPVFYATGRRIFRSHGIYDVKHSDNSVVRYTDEPSPFSHNAAAATDAELLANDRICPYCNQLIAGSLSQTDYEQHVQTHLDSDADDNVI